MGDSAATDLPRELGAGLHLRSAMNADAEALAAFNARVHGGGDWDGTAAAWTGELLRDGHPTLGAGGGVFVVEEEGSGAIVSSAALIPQTWFYEGVPVGVARPELIGTDPAFRRRGLVRELMATLHARSAARGDLLQVITSIPNFYRQFGYEPALATVGARAGFRPHVPSLPGDATEPYRLRPATEEDLPLAMHLAAQAAARGLVAVDRNEALWCYELSGRDPASDYVQEVRVVESTAGEAVGLLVHRNALDGPALHAILYEIVPGRSWLEPTLSVLRALWTTGEAYASRDGGSVDAVAFDVVPDHPVLQTVPRRLPHRLGPFTFQVRVPDLPRFVRHVAPVLERRLASSPLVGYDGKLRLSFYGDGLRLAFVAGRLAAAEHWRPAPDDGGDVAFPGLTFLQLVFGSRDLTELEDAFADCRVNGDTARALLPILFPKRPSAVWPVD